MLREQCLIRLRLVEEALARIDSGTYGICPRCGANIDPARLGFTEAPLCLECQEYEEMEMLEHHRRPVEEEPPAALCPENGGWRSRAGPG